MIGVLVAQRRAVVIDRVKIVAEPAGPGPGRIV